MKLRSKNLFLQLCIDEVMLCVCVWWVCLLALEIQFWIDPIKQFHLDAMLHELNIDSLAHGLSLIRAWFIDAIASVSSSLSPG
jgi:hypothetical protein